ncbi:lipoprotein [Mycoplasma yeatsii]|uniref:lipoprotein n=1 Tax=Mycoplasma yeatsii TaxID=51365 RepID=UPI0005B24924|nr:lipoprotein [Mycoplasma yeatsii]AJM71508.1 lipoprotein [Mycoplasma yeatsii GM274B]
MKKLLTILGSVAMVATTGAVAVACKTEAKPDKPVVVKQKLEELVTVKTGIEVAENEREDVTKVVAAVNKKNENAKLDATQLKIEAVGSDKTKAKLLPKDEASKYQGSVEIEFKGTPAPVAKQKLEELVTVKTGIEVAENEREDVTKVVAAVNKKNENAKLDATQLKIEAVGSDKTKAKLLPKDQSSKYEGSVEIEFKAAPAAAEEARTS